jgi:hypothetical protein
MIRRAPLTPAERKECYRYLAQWVTSGVRPQPAPEVQERPAPPPASLRIGLSGLLGSGNIGNDGSLESLLAYLRNDQPDAVIDSMCTGPDRFLARYGIPAIPLQWYLTYDERVSGIALSLLKTMSKGIDVCR